MLELDGHRVLGVLAETDTRVLLRAQDLATGTPVVVKLLRTENPAPEQRARLEHELAVARDLPGRYAVRPLEVRTFGRRVGLVAEDVGGSALDGRIPPDGLPSATLLDLAIAAAEAIEALHAAGLVHRDVKPANLVLDDALTEVRLVDFGLATRLTRTAGEATERLEGTLAYLAPEQTGRMNRSVDARADLYALGVTLYQMATGRVPFLADSPLELIHAHLAAQPADPTVLRPDLPPGVAAIVLRLLAKQPEDRYQSAAGLLVDLRLAREELARHGSVARFELATRDRAPGFALPERLFGRERELDQLRHAVEETAAGRGGLFLIGGHAGIGKTSLVAEIGPAIAAAHGIFISRKYDQYARISHPVKIIGGLVAHALRESPERLADIRARLLDVVGADLGVLIDVAPSVELLVGPQPAPIPLGSAESEFRFTRAFLAFNRVFARPGSPVVVFLDDLQWAPLFNMKLGAECASDPELGHLLMIGAYRPEEVTTSHALPAIVAGIPENRVRRLDLGPIASGATRELVAEALGEPDADLGEWLHDLTRGNPFHLGQVLESLASDGLLGEGRVDLAAIRAAGLRGDVVGFLLGRIAELPAASRDVLNIAALVGNRFDIDVVAAGARLDPREAAAALDAPIAAGLITPLDDRHELVAHSADGASNAEYRFRHDRVQQAAHADMASGEVAGAHLRLGRHLRGRLQAGDADLFSAVEHLNAAGDLLDGRAERIGLAELNLRAARETLAAAAFDVVDRLTEAGLALLPTDPSEIAWLAFELGLLRATSLGVLGRIDEADVLFASLESSVGDDVEFAQLCEARCEALENAGRLVDSGRVGRIGLARLGLGFPETPEAWERAQAESLGRLLNPEFVDEFADLPAGDGRAHVAARLYFRCFMSAYATKPEDLPLVMAAAALHVRDHGLTDASGFSLGMFSMLPMMSGLPELAVAYGDRAVEIGRAARDASSRFGTASWLLSLSWRDPFARYEEACEESFLGCHEAGNVVYAMYSIWSGYIAAVVAARDCAHAASVLERTIDYGHKYCAYFLTQSRIRAVALSRLVGCEPAETIDVEAMLADLLAAPNLTEYAEAQHELIRIAVLFGEYAEAAAYVDRIEQYVRAGSTGSGIWNAPFYVFGAVAYARLAAAAESAERVRLLERAMSLGTWIDPVADLWPDNWAHYRAVVRAELALAAGDVAAAELNYLAAMDHSALHGYTLVEAWATELLGRVHLATGRSVGAGYLAEARALYLACAADGKTAALDEEFPPAKPARGARSLGSTTSSTSTADGSSSLDLATVVKASQAIASERDPAAVLERLVAIAVENAGAERGEFLPIVDGEVQVPPGAAPAALARYVARLGEAQVVADLGADEAFGAEEYVRRHRPRSAAALPITRSGRRLGVLYLENRLLAGAFTQGRLELLRLLGDQLAISLENARLYTGLEADVAERTRELAASVHELQLMQAQIVESEKLAALGSLVAGVAHEVNTPVGVAVTAASHLADRTREFTAAYGTAPLRRSTLIEWLSTVAESSELIHANLSRATALVGSFKQVAVDQSSEACRRFEIGPYLHDVVASLRPNLRRAEVEVHIECAPELHLVSYPGALAQVVTNLVLNALAHAFDDRGRIDIRVASEPDGVALSFCDDGRGIAPDVLPRIFEPFFTTARGQGGSGLGLHVVHNLVTQRLGGTISVRSTPGQGTRFALTIPEAEAP
ncbi:MAG: trifunctional serine/threonine-protein kinase/ATP-binding protein/sensor histidine kinase [Sporichthyaceae bacterium]